MPFLELRLDFSDLLWGFGLLGVSIPPFIVAAVGMALAVARWGRSRRAAVLVLVAVVLMVVQTWITFRWVPELTKRDSRGLIRELVTLEALRSLTNVGIWTALLCAVFFPGERASAGPRNGTGPVRKPSPPAGERRARPS
jgi:hypothetical protein